MSSRVEVYTNEQVEGKIPLALWWRQLQAIFRVEVKKGFFNRRAISLYLLALTPSLLFIMLNVFGNKKRLLDPVFLNRTFSEVYEGLILRVVIFFGCSWIFINLFRSEIVDKSLHYYFLTPVRRELLVIAKYFSGLLMASMIFSITTLLCLFLTYFPRGYEASMQYIFEGPGLSHILSYWGISVLGCVGYGSIFLLLGVFFRNPILPATFLYCWELISFLLPPVLKKLTIIHYLQSLTPIKLSEGPYAIVAEPSSPWVAIPSMLLLTAVVLVFACLRVRKMEISYSNE
jgi:ABC-type transport system involved in multi-copper enzyme maturation permease subunit